MFVHTIGNTRTGHAGSVCYRVVMDDPTQHDIAEVDSLAAQWFAAAPCPDHGGTALTLGIPAARGTLYQLENTLHGIAACDDTEFSEWDISYDESQDAGTMPLFVAIVCRLCGRCTGSFIRNRENLRSYEQMRAEASSHTQ